MKKITLNILCTIAGLFGATILLSLWFACSQGFFTTLDDGVASLKIITSIVRALFLILCALAVWKKTKYVTWFAWGAFFAFTIGGAADETYKLGFVNGIGNLISTYYIVVSLHALFAVVSWLLSRSIDKENNHG